MQGRLCLAKDGCAFVSSSAHGASLFLHKQNDTPSFIAAASSIHVSRKYLLYIDITVNHFPACHRLIPLLHALVVRAKTCCPLRSEQSALPGDIAVTDSRYSRNPSRGRRKLSHHWTKYRNGHNGRTNYMGWMVGAPIRIIMALSDLH